MKTQTTPAIETAAEIPVLGSETALAICVSSEFVAPGLVDDDRFSFIRSLLENGGFKAEEGDSLVLNSIDGITGNSFRIILIGMGSIRDFKQSSIRDAAATAIREARA